MAARRAGVSAAAGEGQEHRGCAEGMAVCSSPGMSLTAPASGSCGRSLPGLPLLTAWGRKGTGRALAGHGQELLQLKLERPEKVKDDEMEGPPASSCLPPRAGESQPLWCPAPHFWQPSPLPSSPSLQEPTDRLSVPRWTDERGSGTNCRGGPGAGAALGSPSPRADSVPGLVRSVTE
ncbi:uncharacterized protein [Haliaeetus albicilla]|uniref:uncharacterized protein isoform X3 n=1 Tax=Haliaeetus albicilla TaxID=8969 RepID=UPI0037E89CB9